MERIRAILSTIEIAFQSAPVLQRAARVSGRFQAGNVYFIDAVVTRA
jgi:hypothetical protein